MIDVSQVHHVMLGWGAVIGGVVSLASNYFSSRNKKKITPPANPDYEYIKQYGPEMWNKLRGEANNLIDNPYGLGTDIRNRMYGTARDTAEAGYGAAARGIDRSSVLAGLSPGGGSATRQQYYAGQQMAEGLNRAYGDVDIKDYMAKEEQKNRGYNLLFSLSNKSPVYSQIASQNYWNALQASQESARNYGSLLGGAASNITQLAMGGGSTAPNAGSSYYTPGNYDPYQGYNSPSTPAEQSPYTDQGYQGYPGSSPY